MLFFFNDTATTEIYTLSLHDALPISTAAGGSETFPHSQVETASLLTPHSSATRSEEHTSELQSQSNIVCRLLLEKKKHAYTSPSSGLPADREGGRASAAGSWASIRDA